MLVPERVCVVCGGPISAAHDFDFAIVRVHRCRFEIPCACGARVEEHEDSRGRQRPVPLVCRTYDPYGQLPADETFWGSDGWEISHWMERWAREEEALRRMERYGEASRTAALGE